MKPHWHEFNPWRDDIVYVPLAELAECVAGGTIQELDGSVVPYDVARVLKHFHQVGRTKLDAYILPQPSGEHSLGVRYGKEGSEYYSPYPAHPKRVQALLEQYRNSH